MPGSTLQLTVFLTANGSLATWQATGLLSRELALYQQLHEQFGVQVQLVSYGGRTEQDIIAGYPGLSVFCNQWGFPPRLYRRFVHWWHAPALRRTDVIKTNQIYGANIAKRAAHFWKKPLVVRGGYLHSRFVARQQGADSVAARRARQLEADVFAHADAIILTTEQMRYQVQRQYTPPATISIIPNYVDTELFQPQACTKTFDVIFVGRLAKQKNVEMLCRAVQHNGLTLLVIGDGELQAELRARYAHLDNQITWLGKVPHENLPYYLNQSHVFALPSHYEGHPKVLLEAMACALPVVGTNVTGIREVIQHDVNGWLCDTTAASLAQVLHTARHTPERHDIGRNARQHMLKQMRLAVVVEQEYQLYQRILSHQ